MREERGKQNFDFCTKKAHFNRFFSFFVVHTEKKRAWWFLYIHDVQRRDIVIVGRLYCICRCSKAYRV